MSTYRSQSSSSGDDLSSPNHTVESGSVSSAKDTISIASTQSFTSHGVDDSEEDERIIFDALQ